MVEAQLDSSTMRLRRQQTGGRSDGGVYDPSCEPRASSPAMSVADDVVGWGDDGDANSAAGLASDDFPAADDGAADQGCVSCWADLPDGLLREVRRRSAGPSPLCKCPLALE